MPIDLVNPFSAGTLAILAILVDLATSKSKDYVPAGKTHDTTVQVIALAWGAILGAGAQLLTPHSVSTVQSIVTAAVFGALAGSAAIARYHITGQSSSAGSSADASTPPTPPALDSATVLAALLSLVEGASSLAPQSPAPTPTAQPGEPTPQHVPLLPSPLVLPASVTSNISPPPTLTGIYPAPIVGEAPTS